MTVVSPSNTADVPGAAAASGDESFLTHQRGVVSWAFTLDHKRIGVMYLASVLGAFLL